MWSRIISSKRSHGTWIAFGLCPGTHAIDPLLTSSSPSFSPSLRTTNVTSLFSTTLGGIAMSMSCFGMPKRYVRATRRANSDNGDVKFEAEHHFDASPDAVAAVLLDPGFHTSLALPDLDLPTVVARTSDGGLEVLELRYEFVGRLDPIARRLLAGRPLTWVQSLRLHPATEHGTLDFWAEADPKRLFGSASVALQATDGGTTRRLEGDLHVRMPVVGSTAERRIVPGLLQRLDVEAGAVRAALTAD